MSTAPDQWRPAAVPDAPPADLEHQAGDDDVRFGAAEGNIITAYHARALLELWYERAPAKVGTALTRPEVAALVLELLPAEALSLMFTEWRRKAPGSFSAYLGEAITGTTPARARRKAGGSDV